MKTCFAKPRAILLTFTLVSAATGFETHATAFQWPDSSRYNRVIVNAQDGIESVPKEWLSRDALVTDFTVSDADKEKSQDTVQLYNATRNRLVSYGLAVGTYVSGTTVEPETAERKWPWAVIPIEWMSADSVYVGSMPEEPFRKIIDVSSFSTRQAFQSAIKKLWEQTPAPVRFIDNAAVHQSAGNGQPWASYCRNMREIREVGDTMGSVQIFNVAAHIGELSDQEAEQLIEAVGHGGILLEMPWHQNIRTDAAATQRARLRYRQLLDSGMAIILAEPGAEPSRDLVKWVKTWRKPSDHLYFAGAFWKEPDPTLFTLP